MKRVQSSRAANDPSTDRVVTFALRYLRWIALAGFVLIAVLVATAVSASEITGKVVAIADGDTLTVLDSTKTQHRIRLAGIDAPEKAQAFGNASRRSLGDLAFGKDVTVDWNKRDKYQRLVGKVIIEGNDVNLEQVRRGLAWHYVEYEREQSTVDRSGYAVAEKDARDERRGLWAARDPVAPWTWRHRKRDGEGGK